MKNDDPRAGITQSWQQALVIVYDLSLSAAPVQTPAKKNNNKNKVCSSSSCLINKPNDRPRTALCFAGNADDFRNECNDRQTQTKGCSSSSTLLPSAGRSDKVRDESLPPADARSKEINSYQRMPGYAILSCRCLQGCPGRRTSRPLGGRDWPGRRVISMQISGSRQTTRVRVL